ncbi:hypothetical protein D3C74_366940 [compost metagenome]
MEIRIVQIDHRIKIGIPLPNERIKGEYKYDGLRQRNDDLEENLHLGSAIHIRCFFQFPRDSFEEGSGQDDVPDVNGSRNDDCPHRIQHAEITNK